MPPRKEKTSKKEKLSKPNLRDLIRGHGIEFKDSLLPQEWPTQYKHHFQTVRDIAAVRYDDYKKDKMVPKQHWQHFQENIERIIHIACQFSNEEANEPTWRWLEGDILKRFNTRVICKRCEHDLWKADYEAHSHNKEDDAELQRKRMKRQLCGCKDGRPIPKTENDDDENHPCLFTFADDRPVTHTPGDNLQGLSISMKPDRVYGLLAPSKLRNSSSEFPVLERRILLPFLVVEAKRANGAPGFRAIQNQTAFPIRRLLKAQDALYSLGSTREPTLVWFFAYQGELWQLHAAIYKDNKVKIYDLWLGTIKSHDGCLQLLLLVDFIWSWARDIYRPNIMDLLLISDPTLRDFSPASTDRVRESVSVFSARMPTPATPLLGSRQSLPLHSGRNPTPSGFTSAQADPSVLETEDVQGTIPLIEDFEQINADPEEVIVVDGSDLDSYLRWAVDYKFAPPWTKVGSIRYSNIVRFEFKCIDLVWDANVTAEDQEQGDIFRKLYESAFWISRDQLYELVALWTDPDPVLTHYGRYLSVPMVVTLLLQTYCDRSTWQIKRVLTCFVWQLQEGLSCTVPLSDLPVRRLIDGTIEHANLEHLRHNIEDVRQICGRDSVWFAFRSIGMILSLGDECKSPRWIEFQRFGLPEHFQDLLDGFQEWSRAGNIYIADVYTCGSVSLVDPKYERRPTSTIPDLEPDTRNGNSMLVIGSPSRPQGCPQFCLFVLEENTHDGGELCQLLEEAITQKNFYCQHGVRKFRKSDWDTLRGWQEDIKNEEQMIVLD